MNKFFNHIQTACLIGSGILILSCFRHTNSDTGCATLDFDRPGNKINLKLSDLLSDMQIIPLQTADTILVDNISKVFVSEEYILIFETSVMQFDRKGNFIRQLVRAGRGQNEVESYIRKIAVDEQNQIAYIKDSKPNGNIIRVNLRTGEFLQPYEVYAENYDFDIDNERKIIFTKGYDLIKPNPGENTQEWIKFISLNNPISGDSIPLFKQHTDITYRTTFLSKDQEGAFLLFNGNINDTIFRYANQTTLTPLCRIKCDNQYKTAFAAGNKILYKLHAGPYLLFGLEEIVLVSQTINSKHLTPDFKGYFLYDLNKQAFHPIDRIYLDPLDSYLKIEDSEYKYSGVDRRRDNFFPNTQLSNPYVAFVFMAPQIKEYLRNRLTAENTSPQMKEKLALLDRSIQESDNPVLIIGKKSSPSSH